MGQPSVAIPEKIFFKIGEVCDIVDVQAHVLRYWETEFPMLSPQKNRSGQRTYRRRDVEIALRIKELLYEDLYTIAGAKKRLQKEMRDASRLKIVKSDSGSKKEYIKPVKGDEEIDDRELDIEDMELGSIEDDSDEGTSPAINDETREALKSLAAQLLELREMLKNRQPEGSGEDKKKGEAG
ncbi:MAG: MerR family transcriptional regulator [Acidobacteriota bacterium]|nr:MAG: MerR family transcriptional regulator [Acidobacteriota bacterium]